MSKYTTSNAMVDISKDNSHTKILKLVKPNSSVLEFGSDNGIMSRHMKDVLNCKITAIELNADAAKNASNYCEKMIVCDIEKYTWLTEISGEKFDYILFADVLEHLYDPWKVLVEVRKFLNDDGRIILSIPNIAHNAVIMSLLEDEFNYTETGLLDNTHIRFFTAKTLDKMVVQAGYMVTSRDFTYKTPIDKEFSRIYDNYGADVSSFLQQRPLGEVYQFILEVKPADSNIHDSDVFSTKIPNSYSQLFLGVENCRFNELFSPKSVKCSDKIYIDHIVKAGALTKLRFDPSNKKCVVYDFQAFLEDDAGHDYECKIVRHNAVLVKDGKYYFDTDDSQIYLSVPISSPRFFKYVFNIKELDKSAYYQAYVIINEWSDLS